MMVGLSNVLLLLQGIAIASCAIYVASKGMSNLVYVLGGVAIFTEIVSFVGLRVGSGRQRGQGCVWLYAVLLFALLCLHTVAVCGFLFKEDATFDLLGKLHSSTDDNTVRTYLDSHKDAIKWASLSVLLVELFTFTLAICCSRSMSGDRDGEYDESAYVGLVAADAGYASAGVSATPQTDARRAMLNDKYGGQFEKRSAHSYSTMV